MTSLAPTHPAPLAGAATGETDEQMLALWLHGRAPETRRAYEADARAFLAFISKPIAAATLADVQAFADSLAGLAPATQARRLSSVKSLFAYLHRLSRLVANVAAPIRLPPVKNTLAERIVEEPAVHRVLAKTEDRPRDHAMLRLLYLAGLRISEACGLKWRDLQPRGDAGQVTVFGKGGKTRMVLLTPGIWRELEALRPAAVMGGDPVFPSRSGGGHLTPKAAHEVVKAAAERAGLAPEFSAHWLRHAHASHALDRGAPVHLVQATLGHASVATTGRYLHARPTDSSTRYLGA